MSKTGSKSAISKMTLFGRLKSLINEKLAVSVGEAFCHQGPHAKLDLPSSLNPFRVDVEVRKIGVLQDLCLEFGGRLDSFNA